MTTKPDRPRVLLVDDYPDAREMYTEYLEFSGFEVVEAGNGMEALQRAIDASPDIILMDLSLPVMDGWEATRRLKADHRTASIPVVALTADVTSGGREHFRSMGFTDHESKPIQVQSLVEAMARALASTPLPEESTEFEQAS